MGDTVNVGSRLCSQAAAGEVVASQSVLAGAAPDDAEVLAPAGAVVLKGVAEPVPIFRGAPRTATPAETITGVDDADVVPASQWSA
jgi:class 3 adenylate cyclase